MEEGWERPPRLDLGLDELRHLVGPAFPGREVADFAPLATGLANTNIRFRLQGEERTYVLRLHTRGPEAAGREGMGPWDRAAQRPACALRGARASRP